MFGRNRYMVRSLHCMLGTSRRPFAGLALAKLRLPIYWSNHLPPIKAGEGISLDMINMP